MGHSSFHHRQGSVSSSWFRFFFFLVVVVVVVVIKNLHSVHGFQQQQQQRRPQSLFLQQQQQQQQLQLTQYPPRHLTRLYSSTINSTSITSTISFSSSSSVSPVVVVDENENDPFNNNNNKKKQGRFFQSFRQRIKNVVTTKISRPIQNKLWPNTLSDPMYPSNSLPPGPLGCPVQFKFIKGFNPRESTPTFGPGILPVRLFERWKRPSVLKYYSKKSQKGIVIVSGKVQSKTMLSKEFESIVSQVVPFSQTLIGKQSLRTISSKHEHSQLRKLVSMALQRPNVSKLIPSIYETADTLLQRVLLMNNNNDNNNLIISIDSLMTQFTLLVACRHIIGLDEQALSNEEFFNVFHPQVVQWVGGLYASAEGKDNGWKSAREYLVTKISQKIDWLEQHGPDDSTVSGMLFAEDNDENNENENNVDNGVHKRKLTREEIIDNTLLLMFAGSETSSGTLTNCILMLGLNQQFPTKKKNGSTSTIYEKLRQEQEALIQKYGNNNNNNTNDSERMIMNRKMLEECKYLDGVVKESLRIKPAMGGSMKGTTSTIILDGYQIPAGWCITYDRYNTHLMDPVTQLPNNAHMDPILGFDPTRWFITNTNINDDESNDNQSKQQQQQKLLPQEFIPFGAGPRHCIGSDLAMCEMQIFLSAFVRRIPQFELLSPNVEKSSLEMHWKENAAIPIPKDGVVIRLKK